MELQVSAMTSVWSCGGGTQSAAIAALICRGSIQPPDYAVIADTGMERSTTWKYMDEVLFPALISVGVTLIKVKAADYATVGVWGGKEDRSILIPAFTSINGGAGKLPNFCSYEWKRRVVERYMRAQGVSKYESWIGFSTDEMRRVSASVPGPRTTRYPLIELGMRRGDCIAEVLRMGWPAPPRSSCWMCPNMGPREWREVMQSEDAEKAISFDREIRKTDPDIWLTQEMKPLTECNFENATGDLFGCESGECFV